METKIMQQNRENLDILFRRTIPETVLESIRTYGRAIYNSNFLTTMAGEYNFWAYRHFSEWNLADYSADEVNIRFQELKGAIKTSLFQPLADYGEAVLDIKRHLPVCRLKEVLNWNTTSLRLGQDLVVTAWLASRNVKESDVESRMHYFTWPAILKTDDKRLEEMFERGLAENHFHLNGSTQSFALSWACLMNHPDCIQRFLNTNSRFKENLNGGISKGTLDSHLEWKERLLYAARIRVMLFQRCMEAFGKGRGSIMECEDVSFLRDVKRKVECLRYEYGSKFKQTDGRKICLDYANCDALYRVEEDHHNRLLAGERNFLYHCFLLHFQGEMSEKESSFLYLYILIKSHFRSELVQNNGKTGFQNFSDYQDRKDQFFESFPEYWTESFRLSICMAQRENHAISLETRIMPKNTPWEMNKAITDIDKRVKLALEPEEKEPDHFYTIHFLKLKYKLNSLEEKGLLLLPRNSETRKMAETKARALCRYVQQYDAPGYKKKQQRVWGIDACSSEIGCRPETFATVFRFLREESKKQKFRLWKDGDRHVQLGVTYHAGEDFLDIVDGLRAIDEAMMFLQMGKGERLGHAMALGVEPEEYYEFKKWNVYMTKQDWLDNLVWMLYRSLELNVEIKANHRAEMRVEANSLLHEIFGLESRKIEANYGDLLDVYYDAWKLRGDEPSLYKEGEFRETNKRSRDVYAQYEKRNEDTLEAIRKSPMASYIYYLYHFDYEVKQNGLKPIGHEIDTWYIRLVRQFQSALQKEVHKKEMAIECNPTSNVLIGTFKYYDKHPVLAFNDHHLGDKPENPHIQVSINTDDIGVFDTSLENEYALVFESIRRNRYAEGNYNDDEIYEYLEYLRQNGLRMAFRRIL